MRRFASVLAVLGLITVSGCVVRTRGHVRVRPAVVVVDPAPVGVVVVQSEPPPPRYVQVEQRPGFIWIQGRWDWRGNQWYWLDGHWERQRSRHVYHPGQWQRRNNGYVWVEGRWVAH